MLRSSTAIPAQFRGLQWKEKQIPSVPGILVSVVWLSIACGVTGGRALSPAGGFEGLSSPRALRTAWTGGDRSGIPAGAIWVLPYNFASLTSAEDAPVGPVGHSKPIPEPQIPSQGVTAMPRPPHGAGSAAGSGEGGSGAPVGEPAALFKCPSLFPCSSLPGIPFTTNPLCCGLQQLGGVFQAQV